MDSEIRDSSGEGKEGAVAVAERRDFLKTLGIGAAAAAAGAATLVTGRPLEALGAETKTPHYGMLIDLTRCTGCKACEVACKSENNVPLRSEEHTSELQSQIHLVCRLPLEKKKS